MRQEKKEREEKRVLIEKGFGPASGGDGGGYR